MPECPKWAPLGAEWARPEGRPLGPGTHIIGNCSGEMPEWSNGLAWNASRLARVSRVRIPVSPPPQIGLHLTNASRTEPPSSDCATIWGPASKNTPSSSRLAFFEELLADRVES